MEVQAIHKALEAIWQVVADANRYFAGQEPWALRKTDLARMESVLYVTAEVLRHVAILTQPVMPDASASLLDVLGVDKNARDFAHLGEQNALVSGTDLPEPSPIFPRYVEPENA